MGLFDKKKKLDEEQQRQPTNEEQMMLRQSAPRPTAESEAIRLMQQNGQGMDAQGAINGFSALAQVIGKEQVQEAHQTLLKYKQGKANLEKRIVDNEQWYKLRHWAHMSEKNRFDATTVKPAAAIRPVEAGRRP